MFVRLKGSRMAPEVLCSCLDKSEPSLVHGGASVDRICSSMSCGCSDLDLGNQEVRLTSWVGVLLLRGVPYIYIFINVCRLYLPLKMNTLTWAGWSSGGRAAPPVEGRSLVKQFEHSVDWRSITESIYILIGLYFKSRNSLTLTSERVAEIITLRTRLLLCLMDWGVNDFCPACAYIHPGLICDREYSDTNHIFPGGPWHHVLPLQTSLRVKVSFICEQPVQRCRKSGVFMSRAAECWTAEVCGWLRALRCEYKAGGCWERERESAGSLRPPRINNETRRAGRAAPCILVVCYKLL